ncbi:hypothetical protein HPB52_006150 [Rhipicephalus sanguineus]|uniref:Uncharacterized protein n=1 Tax=Rhipicephalus sanguineus TaxID=34632 RepID=A0A9D4PDS4_RHISA|nr:hypothetical protein HPB52_006150 [Rhipicephalus sanguineus]
MDHVHAAGLACSATKSALLLMRPPDRRCLKTPHPTVMVHAYSTSVPVVSHLRVLELILQSNRRNTHTTDQLSLSVQQTARILAHLVSVSRALRAVFYIKPSRTCSRATMTHAIKPTCRFAWTRHVTLRPATPLPSSESRPPRRCPRSRQS